MVQGLILGERFPLDYITRMDMRLEMSTNVELLRRSGCNTARSLQRSREIWHCSLPDCAFRTRALQIMLRRYTENIFPHRA